MVARREGTKQFAARKGQGGRRYATATGHVRARTSSVAADKDARVNWRLVVP